MIRLVCLSLAAMACWSCGSQVPAAPSAPDLSGAWVGEQKLTTFSGGECLAASFTDLLTLPSQFHASITQTGTTVTAMLDIDHTGALCTYTGTLDNGALDLSLIGCTGVRTLGLACANGAVRDLLPASGTLHATVVGDRMTGVATERDRVLVSATSEPVDDWIANASVTLTRQ